MTTVHPRACGELVFTLSVRYFLAGSSPRMRGTPKPRYINIAIYRFIPAHAGNSHLRLKVFGVQTVHPRACGELAHLVGSRLPVAGSSPRMRGTRLTNAAAPSAGRFIPAHAGNSRPRCPP